MITSFGFLYVPNRFRIPLVFNAVLPPIAASTIASRDVGIKLWLIPRIYVDAT